MRLIIGLMVTTIVASGNGIVEAKNLKKADELFQARKYKEAEAVYRRAVESAADNAQKTEALAQVARCRLIDHNKDECAQWLEKAARIAVESEPLGWSRYLGVRGRLEWQSDNLNQARMTFMQMFNFCREQKLTDRAMDAVHMMAIVGTAEQQIERSKKGIKLAESENATKWLGPLWNNLAITYSEQEDWGNCVDAFTKARKYHWVHGNEINKLYADYHIGWSLRMQGEYEQALTWLRPVLNWAERLENKNVIGQACQDIGEITIAHGDVKTGLPLLKRALHCYKDEGYPDWNPEIYNKLEKRIQELEE